MKFRSLVITVLAVVFVVSSFQDHARVFAEEPEPLVGDVFIAPDDPRLAGQVVGDFTRPDDPRLVGPLVGAAAGPPGYYQTSEFMTGRVAVGIILVESDGTEDLSTEDWTAEEITRVEDEVKAAMEWWAAREPRANLAFYYDDHFTSPVSTGYEPINRPHTDQSLWIGQVMGGVGYNAPSYFTRVRDYNDDLRDQYQTDWALTIFVVDSSNDVDNKFADDYFAYAYLGGPFMVMTYGNNGYGPGNMDAVTAHEMGHIFRALDQYCPSPVSRGWWDCSARGGYLDVENRNSQVVVARVQCGVCLTNDPSVMRGMIYPYTSGAVDYYARGQVGWWDSDGDDILDPVDTTLEITLVPQSPNPADPGTFVFTGTVEDVPFPSPAFPSCTINTVEGVQYRFNGGEWLSAVAGDGAYDSYQESYALTITLTSGVYVVDVRATNSAGVVQILAEAEVLVLLDPVDGALQSVPHTTNSPVTEGSAVVVTGTATSAIATTLTGVGWRVGGGSWGETTATDGAFNSSQEGFTLSVSGLVSGTHLIETQARDASGGAETSLGQVEVTVMAKPEVEIFVYLPIVVKEFGEFGPPVRP